MSGKDYQVLGVDDAVAERRRADITQIKGLVDAKAPIGYLMVLPALIYLTFRYFVLRPHCSIVNAYIVDQAGEVGAGLHSLAGANIQTAI